MLGRPRASQTTLQIFKVEGRLRHWRQWGWRQAVVRRVPSLWRSSKDHRDRAESTAASEVCLSRHRWLL